LIQIKIDATESTNDYLKIMLRQGVVQDGTAVRTFNQTHGRGQRGADWYFEKDKSLAISVLKMWDEPDLPNPFHLQWVITQSVFAVLQELGTASWHIKWPNDIMADGKKIAGLLIEHQFKGRLQSSIFGVGVNVNNRILPQLPHAASLAQILEKNTDIEALAEQLIQKINHACQTIHPNNFSSDLAEFNRSLFRKDILSKFEDDQKSVFTGCIQGVTEDGGLLIKTETGLETYAVGMVKLILEESSSH
jgi:BirA family biotin operon repressor/biotin-[acetyl-CoA-carboxylase] ligase